MTWPTIDAATPAGTDKIKFGDDQIRSTKQHIIDAAQAISNYTAAGTTPALKTTVWTTAGRPSGANLVDRVSGFNSSLGCTEYYDLATTTWKPLGLSATGINMTGAINEAKGADIASATTTDIGAATGNYVVITGTTTITGLGTVQAGTVRTLRFTEALTLTHNATSLILPGATNITTAAGDAAEFISLGSGNWVCVAYQRASGIILGVNLASGAEAIAGTEAVKVITPATLRSGVNAAGTAPIYACRVWVNFNGVTGAIRASGNVASITKNGTGDLSLIHI